MENSTPGTIGVSESRPGNLQSRSENKTAAGRRSSAPVVSRTSTNNAKETAGALSTMLPPRQEPNLPRFSRSAGAMSTTRGRTQNVAMNLENSNQLLDLLDRAEPGGIEGKMVVTAKPTAKATSGTTRERADRRAPSEMRKEPVGGKADRGPVLRIDPDSGRVNVPKLVSRTGL